MVIANGIGFSCVGIILNTIGGMAKKLQDSFNLLSADFRLPIFTRVKYLKPPKDENTTSLSYNMDNINLWMVYHFLQVLR